VNSDGADAPAARSMNWRVSRLPIRSPAARTSTSPPAEDRPSSSRALSCSVCRRPIIHVPALDRPLESTSTGFCVASTIPTPNARACLNSVRIGALAGGAAVGGTKPITSSK
jgi:hypothetical protein